MLLGFTLIRKHELKPSQPTPHAKGQIMEGFRYVRNSPKLLTPLIMMALIGTITFEWQASLPLFAKFILNGDAGTYSALSVAIGVGMLIGGIFNASWGESNLKHLSFAALFFGIFVIMASITTSFVWTLLTLVVVGIFAILFSNPSNSMLQLESDPKMRGRVMALWAMAFQGSTAIGGPIVGFIGEYYGARASLSVGGVAAIIAAIYGLIMMRRIEKTV